MHVDMESVCKSIQFTKLGTRKSCNIMAILKLLNDYRILKVLAIKYSILLWLSKTIKCS